MDAIVAFGAALAFLAAQASAPPQREEDAWKAPPPAWEGTWQGTIGSLPVHVCLNNTPYENRGAYYYDQHKVLLSLELDDKGLWVEGEGRDNQRPRWDLTEKGRDELDGTWSDGKKSLPVRLRRIGGTSQEYEGPCSTIEFHRARLGAVQLTSKRSTKDGVQFVTWTFKPGPWFKDVEVSTFTLDGAGPGVAKVNAILKEILPAADGTGTWLECMEGNANAFGSDGEYYEQMEPTLVTRRWLVVLHSGENFCGGAHPNNFADSRTFDLISGSEVDPHDWFKSSAVHIEHYEAGDEPAKMLTKAFRSFIARGWKAQDRECRDSVLEEEFWGIGIARGALTFSPDLPRVVMACGEEIKVPFARLQPWLNAKGKAAVATLPR